MIDSEVFRLRQLRNKALKLRAMARSLQATSVLRDEPVLNRVACSSWRIARTVSGRLVSHPYESYQRGPTALDDVSANARALAARMMVFSRARALRSFAVELRDLARTLADTRALTWAQELSDAFARSEADLNVELRAIETEVGSTDPKIERVAPATSSSTVLDGDWPYLAF